MDDETKVYDAYIELPDGYQVQMMVLKDYPGGRRKKGLKMDVYRSRVWVGSTEEDDPLAHASQEHGELRVAIDACYSLLLTSSRDVISSPDALEAIQKRVHHYFCGPIGAG